MDKSVGSFREMEKRSFLKITEKRFKNSNELGKNKVFFTERTYLFKQTFKKQYKRSIYSNKLVKKTFVVY